MQRSIALMILLTSTVLLSTAPCHGQDGKPTDKKAIATKQITEMKA